MNRLHGILVRLRGTGDAFFAVAVLAVVALLVAPLSPGILDLALALNLGIAATVLVVTLHAPDALRFASFPTLLLLTTLYRLALNVSSTRLVLSRGEAGQVIQAFGRVVVQGNYVVGAVVFAILTLVQLLVVAKGAERVAEVAARFTLDALPGKQMAIDAELRAGAIDAPEARRRRRSLERESQLYGAMDGALKFVKGDAIAGIAIVLVNVAGGLVAGLMRGMPVEAAAKRYALLAIGDGLVSQIPALLIAVAAGISVTRVASEEEGSGLGREIGRQLAADPRALWAVAALLGALAIAPGLPAAPFVALAAAAGGGAHLLGRRARAREGVLEVADAAPSHVGAAGEPAGAPVVIELAPDLLALARAEGDRFADEGLAALRDRLWEELGVRMPPMAVRAGPQTPGRFALVVDGVPAASGRAPIDEALVLAAPEELALAAIPCQRTVEPQSGAPASIVRSADAERAAALAPVRGPLERVLASAAAALRRQAHLVVGVQEVQNLLDALEPGAPALVREATRQIPTALLAEVLRRLVEEEVSIRPLRTILEAILEAGPARGAPALAERCRRALARHIAHRCGAPGTIDALLLDPAVEAALRDAMLGEHAALEPGVAGALLDEVGAALRSPDARPVLLTTAEVRRALRNLVAPRFPLLAVVGYEELPSDVAVRPLGRVSLAG